MHCDCPSAGQRHEERGAALKRPTALSSAPRSATRAKRQRLDARRKSETRLSFDRQRLQTKLTIRAANENIGADSYADSRRRIDAAVLACQRVAPRSLDGSKYVPGENAAVGCAEIQAELMDPAIIMLPPTTRGREAATQFLARRDDEAEARRDFTTQGADFDILVGRSRRRQSEDERRGDGGARKLRFIELSNLFGQISDATPARCANVPRRQSSGSSRRETSAFDTHSIPRGRAPMKSRKLLTPDDTVDEPATELGLAAGQGRIYVAFAEQVQVLISSDRRAGD